MDRRAEFEALGFLVESVEAINADSTDLKVRGNVSTSSRQSDDASDDLLLQLDSLAESISGMGAQVEAGYEIDPLFSVVNDSAPFYAGGYMKSGPISEPGITPLCSSGFAVRLNGVNRVTTARHCRPDKGTWQSRDGSNVYGNIVFTSNQFAAMALEGAGRGRVFNGAWYNANTPWVPVKGFQDVSVGDFICTNGGNSNVHCDIKVVSLSNLYPEYDGTYFYSIRGLQINGRIAVAGGDSGGPVLVPVSDGFRAVGMIQGGGSEDQRISNCGSRRDATACYKDVYFTSMRSITQAFGATLLTE